MATTYTDNLLLPLLSDGSENWGALFNAAMEIMDREVKAAQSPLYSLLNETVLVSRLNGETLFQHYQL